MWLNCSECDARLTNATNICFFQIDEREVHIALKPEERIRVIASSSMTLKKVADSKCKSADCKCLNLNCNADLGAEISINQITLIAFGTNKVSLCGVPPMHKSDEILSWKKSPNKKKPKFWQVYSTRPEWATIQRRTEDTFFPKIVQEVPSAHKISRSELLIPDGALLLPTISTALSTDAASELSALSQMKEEAGDSLFELSTKVASETPALRQIEQMFGWAALSCSEFEGAQGAGWLVKSSPRDYQISAFLEGLLRDLVIVLPPGTGKTLIAAMLIHRMKLINPGHMLLFLVDRVPLVFQQGKYIRRETDLRVCCMCGENRNELMLRQINSGKYDVLVATGGSVLDLVEKKKLDIGRQFCCVVFDECHHAIGNHVYSHLLDKLSSSSLDLQCPPRLIGLTASPMTANTRKTNVNRLNDLREKINNAAVFYPNVPANPVKVSWILINRDAQQRNFARLIIGFLRQFVDRLNLLMKNYPVVLNDYVEDLLEEFLSPASLGRLRGALESARCYFTEGGVSVSGDEAAHFVQVHNFCRMILAALEASEVMGTKYGWEVIRQMVEGTKHDSCEDIFLDIEKTTIRAFATPTLSISPRLTKLLRELRDADSQPRVLVIVHSREVVRRLTELLCDEPDIKDAYHPQMFVGHGGVDGMQWFGEQDVALEKFRRGGDVCRLLVCTSVLEEGIDVAECDLVIRLQGVQSLIGFIQSRGRARKNTSRMLVFVSDRESGQMEKMRQQEKMMKAVVDESSHCSGLPSSDNRLITNILSSFYRHRGLECDSRTGNAMLRASADVSFNPAACSVVLRMCLPSGRRTDQGMLEDEFSCSLANAGLGAVRVSRMRELGKAADDSTGNIFTNARSFIVGLSGLPPTLANSPPLSLHLVMVVVVVWWWWRRQYICTHACTSHD
jgi:ERCC4-related helicase